MVGFGCHSLPELFMTLRTAEPLLQAFPAARFIKEIGRGKDGARDMSRADADELYSAMLAGRVSDLELGGILLALRIKGESIEEIAGFLDAAERSFAPLEVTVGEYAPVAIPSYNGARNMANLTPLLAMLLAREGVPVLVHGVLNDPNRVTSAEIFSALGLPLSDSVAHAQNQIAGGGPAFMAIETLAPRLAYLLSLRRILGVRSSTHTLVKILQPFTSPALRLSSSTPPEYLQMLGQYFSTLAPVARGDIFFMRGTEGETVANARRAQQIDWFHGAERRTLTEKQGGVDIVPNLPAQRDASCTARWIETVLAGSVPVPGPILEQVGHTLAVSRQLAAT